MNSEHTHACVAREVCELNGARPKHELAQIVAMARLELYNRGVPCGPKAVREHLDEGYAVHPLPSPRTIARILQRKGLSNGRTGLYDDEPGRPAPKASR